MKTRKPVSRTRNVLSFLVSGIRKVLTSLASFVLLGLAFGIGNYYSSVASYQAIRVLELKEAETRESQWFEWQQDQIKKYKQEHPQGNPKTKDFDSGSLNNPEDTPTL